MFDRSAGKLELGVAIVGGVIALPVSILAATMLQLLRRIDGVSADRDMYATNRLIDLYSGVLDGRARSCDG